MEQEEFTSDILQDQLLCVKPSFQDDKFLKTNNYLNIPDTIPENSSVELSENSLKMEAPPALKESIVREDKDNVKGCQSVRSDEPSSSGTIIAVDNSFIINCERKLLESSSSDEKTIGSANLNIESGFFSEIPRKLGLVNNTISTPPSILRKQISLLSNEMAEAYEFHDLELQVLKEDKCINEGDPDTNLQWVEKYAALMDLYTSLKNEFDQYRREQENLQYKAADCLENLCSQIEASDSSLNFSTASFISFNTEVKSSTMLENISEVEATVVHDGTVLVNDPLSITNDMTFKTPTSSAKKLFPQGSSVTKEKPTIREVKNLEDLIAKHETTIPFNSDYNLQLLDVETKLYDKMKELRDLEQRLFKIEDFSSVLQNEHERIASGLVRENNALKENMSKKSEELDELTQKLFTEIIALKPSLKDSLGDAPGSKLLPVFIETIMESCKSVQDELVKKYSSEKTEWETQKKVEMTTIENLENQIKSLNEQLFTQEMKVKEFDELKEMYDSLKEKMSETESLIITREEEIRILQSHDSNIRRTREELASAKETIMTLEAQILSFESEKKELADRCLKVEEINVDLKNEIASTREDIKKLEAQIVTAECEKNEIADQCQKLEEMTTNLKIEIAAKESLLRDMEEVKSSLDEAQNENESLKKLIQESKESVADLKNELSHARNDKDQITLEIENLRRKENCKLDSLFEVFDESQKILLEILSTALPSFDGEEEESLLVYKNIEDKLSTPQLLSESTNTKFLSLFIKSVVDCCKLVKEELNKEFTNEKTAWETERNSDASLIENLQSKIKHHEENKNEHETKICEITSERDEFRNLCDSLKEQLSQAESSLTTGYEKIRILQSHDFDMKQTRDELAAAREAVKKLEAQIVTAECEKNEIADQCQKLEEMTTNLKIEIAAKESLLRDMEEVKSSLDEARNENESLKKLIQESKESIADLRDELSLANSDKEKILLEVENLRNRENDKLENLFEKFEKTNKILIDMLSNTLPCFDENESGSFYENVEKNLSNSEFLSESTNAKFLSLFTKSVIDCCKRVKEELNKEFTNEKTAWETERNVNLTLIENLQNRIKIQEEKEEEQEVKISEITRERNELAKLCELLKEQLSQAENNICSRNEEIRVLQSNDSNMKRTREELASAKETISKLESKISVTESEKVVIENRCQELEEGTTNLKNEIAAKEYLLRDLEKLKMSFDNAQSDIEILKKLIEESEGIIIGLKNELSAVKKEKDELIMEIESLRLKENWKLDGLFDVFVECDKMLLDVVSNTTSWFDEEDEGYRSVHENVEKNLSSPEFLSDSRNAKFVSLFTKSVIDCCRHVREELRKEFSREKADWETQKKVELTATENLENQIKSLNEQLFFHEGKLKEFEDLKKTFDSLKEKMCENESLILSREEEIRILKSRDSNIKRTQADLASAKETIVRLETEISLAEAGRKEVEDRCQELEEGTKILKNEMAAKENLVRDFESLKFSFDNAQSDNASLKQLIQESEGVISELKIELSLVKNDNEKIMLEMENLRIEENCKLDNLFKIFDESQKILMEVMSNALTCFDGGENEGSIYENVEKNLSNPKFLSDSTNTKFLSLFTKSVVECCKLVKESLWKDFSDQKIDWETKRNGDLDQIENLQSLIRGHEENKDKREAKISEITSERNEFKKLCETLREKLSKAENIISNRDEEILGLKDQEDLLRQLKNSPSVMKKVAAHINKLEAKANELKAENAKLDEECDSYAKTIKELKKEAVLVWKSNKEKTESMEAEISRLKEEKNVLETEKQELLAKITKLDKECEKLKSGLKSEGSLHACSCGNELKKINDLRRTILMREQKILELRDLETQNSLYKSQIEYLENALEREKKKISEEKQKNKKLQNELNEATKNHKAEEKKSDESNMLEELRMRGSVSGGVVQEFVDKEKMRKLSKDIGILKELCRARYAEIKRLENENAALRNATPKNSIQMDSPLRTKAYNTRSKNTVKDIWKPDIIGKENVAL